MKRRVQAITRGGRAIGGRLPYRSGMIVSAVGIGIALCGFAVKGVLRFDTDTSFHVPRFLQGWLASGGLRIIADAELSDPRLLFAGIGLTFLLVGAAQLVNDFMNRQTL